MSSLWCKLLSYLTGTAEAILGVVEEVFEIGVKAIGDILDTASDALGLGKLGKVALVAGCAYGLWWLLGAGNESDDSKKRLNSGTNQFRSNQSTFVTDAQYSDSLGGSDGGKQNSTERPAAVSSSK